MLSLCVSICQSALCGFGIETGRADGVLFKALDQFLFLRFL